MWLHPLSPGPSRHLHVDESTCLFQSRSWLVSSPHGPVSLHHLWTPAEPGVLQWVAPKPGCPVWQPLPPVCQPLKTDCQGLWSRAPSCRPPSLGSPETAAPQGWSLTPGWGLPGAQLQPYGPSPPSAQQCPLSATPLLSWGSSRRSHQSPISGHLPACLAQRNVCFRSNSSRPVSRLLSHGAPHQSALTGPFGISKGWNLLALFSSALPPAAWGSESLTRGRSEVGTGLVGGRRGLGGPPYPGAWA